METPPKRRWLRRAAQAAAVPFLLLALFLAVVVLDGWTAFGHRAEGPRLTRVQGSPQWSDGSFQNPQPLWNDAVGMLTHAADASPDGSPALPLPVIQVEPERFQTHPDSGLRVTWLGHSTLLIEIDGYRVLTDPVWGPRASPLTWLGPERWYAPLIELDDLPPLDAVLISHDHYDHLDLPTITALRDRDVRFITPLGVGAHLAYWGVPESRITELDWWDKTAVGKLEIVATPARHASGRVLLDKDATLWASYALIGPERRAWFSGDTGLFPDLKTIGERLGPFDVTLIESGAYDAAWPDWHLGPEQAVLAHQLVRGDLLIPIHWGLFNLAYHAWTEPAERILAAADQRDVKTFIPRPGQSVEPAAPPDQERWWPDVPWRSAADAPVQATHVEGLAAPAP